MNNFKTKMIPYVFIGPAILLLLVFAFLPILISLGISFTNLDLLGLVDYSNIQFTGFANYVELFKDDVFIKSIFNTMFYVIIGVPLAVGSSFVIAFFVYLLSGWISSAFRVIFYMPSVTNIVAIAVIWGFLYNQEYGLFNYMLSLIDVGKIPWLEDPLIAKISLIMLAVWKSNGVSMLIFLAALQSIPTVYYEAAEIDGANRWQQLFKITLPSMSFATFFVTITTMIGWIQFFEEPFIMTDGGPLNGTNSMALFIYQEGFQYNEFGYGAAASFVLFAIVIIATLIQFKFRKSDQTL